MSFVDLKTASLFCSWKVAVIVPVAAFCLRQAVQLFGMPRNKCSKGGVVHCLVSIYLSTVYLEFRCIAFMFEGTYANIIINS